MFTHWNFFATDPRPSKSRTQRLRDARARRARRRLLGCELLEDRRLLAGLTVNTITDIDDGDTERNRVTNTAEPDSTIK